MSELAKRWIVAGVGVPAVIGLLYLGGWPLAVPVAALAVLGAVECFRLAGRGGVSALAWLGGAGAGGLVLLAAALPTFFEFAPAALVLVAVLTIGSLISAIAGRGPEGKPLEAVSVTVFGALYVGLPLSFALLLHRLPEEGGWAGPTPAVWGGLYAVALPLATTWLGDAAALFAGSAWGRGGLAPSISPSKSWVGVWAGLGGATVAGVVWYLLARTQLPGLPVPGLPVAAAVGVLLGIGAILGDLAESLLKRQAGVKDSGAVFPGHGGVLDRLDALIVTLPAAYAVLVALDVGS